MRRIAMLLGLGVLAACRSAPQQAPQKESRPAEPQTVVLKHVVAAPVVQRTASPQAVARVGQPAPDFTLPAYYRGRFTTETLSKHRGRWVLLCFYPGDFTFV